MRGARPCYRHVSDMSYTLETFGSYTVGGRLMEVTTGTPKKVQFTRTASWDVDPRGHFAVEHAYVQYFVPAPRNAEPPVVLVHGGGMSGSCWETTPDGRPGWLHLLLDRGYEVHVVDNVERGRAGFAPGVWGGEPLLRSLEEAWVLFRIGTKDGFKSRTPFPDQRFPAEHFDAFARSFVPRWLGTTPLQTAALLAVLQRIGPAKVICHSQGGEIAFDAEAQAPSLFHSIIALEPSGLPIPSTQADATPLVLIAGDYLDTAAQWVQRHEDWQALANGSRPVQIIGAGRGHSHMIMMDKGHDLALNEAL